MAGWLTAAAARASWMKRALRSGSRVNSGGRSAKARDLPVTWSQNDNVRWRARLPSWSAATPIVWGDTVFVTSAQEGFTELGGGPRPRSAGVASADKIFLIALDRKDGSIRW